MVEKFGLRVFHANPFRRAYAAGRSNALRASFDPRQLAQRKSTGRRATVEDPRLIRLSVQNAVEARRIKAYLSLSARD
jgi:hypothetical protein